MDADLEVDAPIEVATKTVEANVMQATIRDAIAQK